MAFAGIIFEKGIGVGTKRNNVQVSHPTISQISQEVWELYQVRPILLLGDPTESDLLLSLDGTRFLFADLRCRSADFEKSFQFCLNVEYTVGATIYHCKNLARIYSRISGTAADRNSDFNLNSDMLHLSGESDAYFEFDAVITSARRTYESLRHVLWSQFGPRGHTPSNFEKTLAACRNLPAPLRDTLVHSWSTHGTKLKEYRDCIQHYAPVTFGYETAVTRPLKNGLWSVQIRIPDNPSSKSKPQFRFLLGLDALTYAWEVTNELVYIVNAIGNSIGCTDASTENPTA